MEALGGCSFVCLPNIQSRRAACSRAALGWVTCSILSWKWVVACSLLWLWQSFHSTKCSKHRCVGPGRDGTQESCSVIDWKRHFIEITHFKGQISGPSSKCPRNSAERWNHFVSLNLGPSSSHLFSLCFLAKDWAHVWYMLNISYTPEPHPSPPVLFL